MSVITISNYKNREPFATNPIFNKKIKIGCPYCTHPGPKKNQKTLWILYMHFRTHHRNEPNYKEKIKTIADLVIEGVLF